MVPQIVSCDSNLDRKILWVTK